MNVSVRSYLSSGLAAATATVIVVAPMQAQAPAEAASPPVALAAQVQPLQVPTPAALVNLPAQLPALIAQQVSFNGGVAVNFIVTGAQLIGQQVQVARTLVNDISNGTPVPVAVGRAVAGFIQIEVVAGHDLVAFGRQLVDFQITFLGNLVSQLPPVIAAPAGHAVVAGNIPLAQSQSRQTVRTQAASRPDNIVTLRRDNSRSTAVQGDSKPSSRVTHRLRDVIAGSDYQQRHRRDRQQDNAGDDNARHRKADN